MVKIFLTGSNGIDQLEDLGKAQFGLLLTSLFRHFENLHYQYLEGAMGNDAWDGWSQRIIGSTRSVGALEFWDQQKMVFSPKFREFVEESRKRNAGAPAMTLKV